MTTEELESIRQTLKLQEAKVIIRMRECDFQTLTIMMENGKVIHMERKEPIKIKD